MAARCSPSAFNPGWRPPRRHDAELVEQPAPGLHRGRAHAHPVRACAVQRQHGLLLDALLRHAPDVALLRGQPDRPRVGRVVLVAAHEGPHLRRRQQLHPVAQAAKYARPMMCAAAGFHHDVHRLQLREVRRQLGPRQLLAPDLARLSFNPVQLHHVLGNVQTVSRTIHSGPPSAKFHKGTSLWHSMPCDARPQPRRRLCLFLDQRYSPFSASRTSQCRFIGWEVSMPSPGRLVLKVAR